MVLLGRHHGFVARGKGRVSKLLWHLRGVVHCVGWLVVFGGNYWRIPALEGLKGAAEFGDRAWKSMMYCDISGRL